MDLLFVLSAKLVHTGLEQVYWVIADLCALLELVMDTDQQLSSRLLSSWVLE